MTSRADDLKLGHRFAAGDPEAMRLVYERYVGPVLTVATSKLADRDLVDEAVQETFLKAWRARASFDPDRTLSPWLYMIARRTADDVLRRERRRPTTVPLAVETLAVDHGPAGDPWDAWQVRSALRHLSDEERELVRLAHHIGLTRTQIAHKTGLPIGTVKSRLHRVHRKLARQLAHLREPMDGQRQGDPRRAAADSQDDRGPGHRRSECERSSRPARSVDAEYRFAADATLEQRVDRGAASAR